MTTELLQAEGICVEFGGLRAVDDASITVRKGEISGLIGPNGAGKSTLFNAITGLVPTSGGRVRFSGRDISGMSPPQRAAAGIRRTFQSVQLVPDLTVLENVLVGLHVQAAPASWIAMFNVRRARQMEAELQEKALEALEFLGIRHLALSSVPELTFAEQRFVEIARAIVAEPAVLMLDEPAAGLSAPEIEALDALLRRLCAEREMAVLLVEHVLSLVMGISNEVTVLDNGRLIARGAPENVQADPGVRAAYLGESEDAVG